MVLLALTGTPGAGKTSVAGELVRGGWGLVDLAKVVERRGLSGEYDIDRDTHGVDTGALASAVIESLKLTTDSKNSKIVIEGHLSHELGIAEAIVVLRCEPRELARRLEARGYPRAKLEENCEAEALDIIAAEVAELAEADEGSDVAAEPEDKKPKVAELDTSAMDPAAAAAAIVAWLEGRPSPAMQPPGTARWLAGHLGVG